jgi:carboxyl-terminal processing protease
MMRKIFAISFSLFLLSFLLACTYSHYFINEKPSEWQRFLEAYNIIKTHYVKPVPDETLINNAIKGMLEGLDAHSTYLDEQDLNYLKQITTGEYSGIGIEVMPTDGALKVITPLDGGPAQKAGILPEDEIIEINQKSISDMTFREILSLLRGPSGSKVNLTIIRKQINQPLHIELIRTKLDMQNVTSKLLPNHIGYIRVTFFQENTAQKIKAAVLELRKKNIKSLILDLRNNPGGLLQSATEVSDLFLDDREIGNNRLIVYSKDRTGKINYEAKADDLDILPHIPIIILINKGSASGAEIVAGALHDHHRAILVGTQTFGKGSVQTVIPFDNKSAIKLTTALYYTPNGSLIDHIGIPPDVEVSSSEKADLPLKKATEILICRSSS